MSLLANYRLHLAQNILDIFVPRHYLFQEVNKHIFVPNGGYRVSYSSNTICIVRRFENWEVSLTCSPVPAGAYSAM